MEEKWGNTGLNSSCLEGEVKAVLKTDKNENKSQKMGIEGRICSGIEKDRQDPDLMVVKKNKQIVKQHPKRSAKKKAQPCCIALAMAGQRAQHWGSPTWDPRADAGAWDSWDQGRPFQPPSNCSFGLSPPLKPYPQTSWKHNFKWRIIHPRKRNMQCEGVFFEEMFSKYL